MSVNTFRLSREDYKKKRELEELRKAGAAPAELDEDGNMINPHIPQYISEAPWYLQTGRAGLKHQRQFREPKNFAQLDQWFPRGQKKGPAATKFRKGACENCGAASHKTQDCVERKRKRGAKWTNKDIQADEAAMPDLKFDFAGKRDRWNGYDVTAHHRQFTEYHQKMEKARRAKKAKELNDALKGAETEKKRKRLRKLKKLERKQHKNEDTDSDSDSDSDSDGSDSDSDDDLKDSGAMIQSYDQRARQSVRNLRIREDTAKYLQNLDPKSAHYDPKTRSMRQNPHPELNPEDAPFAGDNFTREAGDTLAMRGLEYFAWQSDSKGAESQKGVVHLPSNPTKAEYIQREHLKNQDKIKDKHKSEIVDKYGGEKHLNGLSKSMLMAQSEQYVEYARDGRIVKGGDLNKEIPKSKYIEDELDANHTKIWGSYFDAETKEWGYGCCHQTTRNAYCTGDAGKRAVKEIKEEIKKRVFAPAPMPSHMADKRAGYNYSSVGNMPTEEEMSEYRRTKERPDDPMAKYVDEDEDDAAADGKDELEERRKKRRKKKKDKSKRPKKKRKAEKEESD